LESGDGMKRWKQSLNDPRRIIEHPHGDWVRYDDIPFHPDIAETELERRQKEGLANLNAICADQHNRIQDLEKSLKTLSNAPRLDWNIMDSAAFAEDVLLKINECDWKDCNEAAYDYRGGGRFCEKHKGGKL